VKTPRTNELYFDVLVGERKEGKNLFAEQMNDLRTPERAIKFAFDQGIGFVSYAGYGMEMVRAWKKRDPSPTRAAAARELAEDPNPRTSLALKLFPTRTGLSALPRSRPLPSEAIRLFWRVRRRQCPTKRTLFDSLPPLQSFMLRVSQRREVRRSHEPRYFRQRNRLRYLWRGQPLLNPPTVSYWTVFEKSFQYGRARISFAGNPALNSIIFNHLEELLVPSCFVNWIISRA
jgi:hypothetical protein